MLRLFVVFFLFQPIFAQQQYNLKAHVEYLSSAQLHGRLTGSLGQKIAAIYIQNQFDSVVVDSYQIQKIQHGGYLILNSDTLHFKKDFLYQGVSNKNSGNIYIDSLTMVSCKAVDFFDIRKRYTSKNTLFVISDWDEFLELFGHEFIEEEYVLTGVNKLNSLQFFVNEKRWTKSSMLSYNLIEFEELWFTENLICPLYFREENKKTLIFSAHYDHLGRMGNQYFPGADDNASGVSILLELAQKLKNSLFDFSVNIVFVFFSAEEQGLLGSQYFVQYSPFFPQNIEHCFNFDMVGFVNNNNVQMIRYNSSPLPDLDLVSEDIQFQNVDQESFLHEFSSDHQNFVQNNIASTLFFTGLHNFYHTPNDTPEKLNYSAMNELVQALFQLLTGVK